jgi:hypothetical protein
MMERFISTQKSRFLTGFHHWQRGSFTAVLQQKFPSQNKAKSS